MKKISLTGIDHKLKYLLAVSGGVDSVVMADLFVKGGYNIGIAHCNFGLRGDESDGDENFVEEFAKQNNVVFHTIKFDTKKYAEKNGLSIQQAARELRYNRFGEIKNAFGYDKIAIAHNADDNIETFFINLIRGTGLKGLTGIRRETDILIRPLLNVSRREIMQYAAVEKISYREDSSNFTDHYLRNNLRRNVIPLLFGINPNFGSRMSENSDFLNEANKFIEAQVAAQKQDIIRYKGENIYLSIEKIKKSGSPEFLLFAVLESYGFKGNTIKKIVSSLDSKPGKRFVSDSHMLTKDRDALILSPKIDCFCRQEVCENSESAGKLLRIKKITVTQDFVIEKSPKIALLDCDKLKFPLVLRQQKSGDKFIPLGMKGFKKLSDFLVDRKIPINEKIKIPVLVSGNDIVWVVGMRIDDRYKITDNTNNIFRLEASD